jgi:hypothetical protein
MKFFCLYRKVLDTGITREGGCEMRDEREETKRERWDLEFDSERYVDNDVMNRKRD